jgi:hypothetical protein
MPLPKPPRVVTTEVLTRFPSVLGFGGFYDE